MAHGAEIYRAQRYKEPVYKGYEPDAPWAPDIGRAAEAINREGRSVKRQLERLREQCALEDDAAPLEARLAELRAETPEQRLAVLMVEHEQKMLEYHTELWQRRWDRYIHYRGNRYDNCTMANYEVVHDGQKPVIEAIRRYGANMRQMVKEGTGIVLYGPCGTGKDHLLTALARHAILNCGLTVRWMSGTDIATEARKTGKDEEPEVDIAADIVSLSDPAPPGGLDQAGGYATRAAANYVHAVVDSCYSDCKPIWVTINATDKEHAVQQLGPQVVDRLTDNAIVLSCDWPSYRKPKGAP